MGNGQSQDEEEKVGYRVLGVQSNSPGSVGGFVSFFDFIVAGNGIPLKSMDTTFVDLIKASEDNPLILTVYNCKSHTIRETVVTPTRKWAGEGLLGVIIRFDTYHDAEDHMCHVLDVETNSPAELAGLQPMTDFLLGTVDLVFKNTDILFEVLSSNLNKPVEFYVYNSDTDEVRLCVLMPTNDWGGEGILGASIACGYLHRLPIKCCQSIGMSYEGTIKNNDLQSPFSHYNDKQNCIIPVIDQDNVTSSLPVEPSSSQVDPSALKIIAENKQNRVFELTQTTEPSITHTVVTNKIVNEIPSKLTNANVENLVSKNPSSPSSSISFGSVLSFFDGNPPSE